MTWPRLFFAFAIGCLPIETWAANTQPVEIKSSGVPFKELKIDFESLTVKSGEATLEGNLPGEYGSRSKRLMVRVNSGDFQVLKTVSQSQAISAFEIRFPFENQRASLKFLQVSQTGDVEGYDLAFFVTPSPVPLADKEPEPSATPAPTQAPEPEQTSVTETPEPAAPSKEEAPSAPGESLVVTPHPTFERKPIHFEPRVGLTSVQYLDSRLGDSTQLSLMLMPWLVYQPTERRWSVGATCTYSALALTRSDASRAMTFFHAAIHFGYDLGIRLGEKWKLVPHVGFFLSTMTQNSRFGYGLTMGPQLYPVVTYQSGRYSLEMFAQFSPVAGDGFSLLPIENREIGGGATLAWTRRQGPPLSVGFEIRSLQVPLPTVTVGSRLLHLFFSIYL
ncbi:MAG: hypothetical protein AB7F66_00320 [Bacteriovoracia bacterium]